MQQENVVPTSSYKNWKHAEKSVWKRTGFLAETLAGNVTLFQYWTTAPTRGFLQAEWVFCIILYQSFIYGPRLVHVLEENDIISYSLGVEGNRLFVRGYIGERVFE